MRDPSVAILLAIYNPNVAWLIELLRSLNEQTYRNLHLYVRDDASTSLSTEKLEELLRKEITAFPYTLFKNEKNLGSNETFARLTADAREEDYLSYCDQDDVWLPRKVENTVRCMQQSPLSPRLVCSNVKVIDGEGRLIAQRIEEHRRRHILLRGKGLFKELIYRNFVIGCTAMIRREDAVRYLPFPSMQEAVHDHYLAFRAACEGAIDVLDEPQMLYRVYGGNQTGVLSGVRTKEDYLTRRIEGFRLRIDCFSRTNTSPALSEADSWCRAREANAHRQKGGFGSLWRLRHLDSKTSLLELFLLRLPAPLFGFAIRQIRKGRL